MMKISRVIAEAEAGAPHEVLLVVDGDTGQDTVARVKAFDDVLTLTSLIATQVDCAARVGVLAAITRARTLPVYLIGVGARLEDLQTFNARQFADALLAWLLTRVHKRIVSNAARHGDAAA
jgi:fused signal recognition particle receptor